MTSYKIERRAILLVAVFLVLAVPTLAFAVPGSGEFISNYAPGGRSVTELYNILAKICLAILLLVEGLLLVAIIKFRRKSADERPVQTHGNLKLEIGWTLAAAVVQVYIGVITINVMTEVEVIPEPENIGITVEAIAYQWGWQFRYPDYNGMLTDDLVVPAHTNVKLEITSRDVIHSIFIPELGVKMDAVPGRFNLWWFNADGPVNQVLADGKRANRVEKERKVTTRPDIVSFFNPRPDRDVTGLEERVTYLAASRTVEEVSPYAKYDAVEYRGMCTEICGKGHYNMYFRTVAMTQTSFDQWVKDQQTGSTEADGGAIYQQKCASCHGADGAGVPGSFPPLVNVPWTNDDTMKDAHIEVVLKGSEASTLQGPTEINGVVYNSVMQPWHDTMNDVEVAAVVNHERISWGNKGTEVSAEDVERVRASLGLPPFPAGGAEPIPESELLAEGENLYAACASCHGADGKAMNGVPNLAGNTTVLSDVKGTIASLVNGQDKEQWPGMKSPMGRSMTDRQLSALITYMRKSWGNEGGVVLPDEIQRLRKEVQK